MKFHVLATAMLLLMSATIYDFTKRESYEQVTDGNTTSIIRDGKPLIVQESGERYDNVWFANPDAARVAAISLKCVRLDAHNLKVAK